MHAYMLTSIHISGASLQPPSLHCPFPTKSTKLLSRHTLPADIPLGKSDSLLQTYQHPGANLVPLALEERSWGPIPEADHLFLYPEDTSSFLKN